MQPVQRFKAFDSAAFGDDIAILERGINDWLSTARPHVQMLAQSTQGSHLVISMLYTDGDDSGEAVAVATESVAVPDVFERTLEDSDLDPTDETLPALPEAELPY